MTFYLNNGNYICSQYTASNLFAGNCEENKLRKYTKTITGVYIKFILNRVLNNISRLDNFFSQHDIPFRLC